MAIEHCLGCLSLLAVHLGLTWWFQFQQFAKIQQEKILSGQGQRQSALQFTEKNGLPCGVYDGS